MQCGWADVPLDALADKFAQHRARQRIQLDAVALERESVGVALALGRTRRQSVFDDLILGQRDPLDGRCLAVVALAEFVEPTFQRLRDYAPVGSWSPN